MHKGRSLGALRSVSNGASAPPILALGDAHGLPIAIHTEAATPAEVKLVEATLEQRLVKEKPLPIIADKVYDSDPLRERLLEEEMLLLAPHRRGRTKPSDVFRVALASLQCWNRRDGMTVHRDEHDAWTAGCRSPPD